MTYKNKNEIIQPIEEIDPLEEDLEEFLSDGSEDIKNLEQTKNALGSKENIPSYQYIKQNKLEEGEEPLSRVVGHVNQKKELLCVIDWFKRSKELKEKGISIPKGVILFGDPGNGKSLLIKEIIRCCEAPVFVFQGEQMNVVEGICETFKKAREAGHAIIVFDELDLLINKERRVIRALQENLDGVESSDDILVLAATNYLRDIPDPLLRNGRLEKLIKIPYPTGEEALELFKKICNDFKLKLPDDLDEDELIISLNCISYVSVKAIVNDLVLRNGFDNITQEMIDQSIYNITDRIKDTPDEENIEVACHEAGHAVMAKHFPKYFTINRINISGASGEFHAKELERGYWPYEKVIADIQIAMAGVISEKVLFNKGSRGCESDLQRARINAYNMINMTGYSSCWETLPVIRQGARVETSTKRRRMERKIESLLKTCEKETTKYVKEHRDEIYRLGSLLLEKKHLKSSEIISCIG